MTVLLNISDENTIETSVWKKRYGLAAIPFFAAFCFVRKTERDYGSFKDSMYLLGVQPTYFLNTWLKY